MPENQKLDQQTQQFLDEPEAYGEPLPLLWRLIFQFAEQNDPDPDNRAINTLANVINEFEEQ